MKDFKLGLAVVKTTNPMAFARQLLEAAFATGLCYMIIGIIASLLFKGEAWGYLETVDKNYFAQFVILLLAVVSGIILRALYNKYRGVFFWYVPIFFEIIHIGGFIVAYLAINEIWGL